MKLELLVPTSTAEIPLKSYQEFMKISEDSNDDEFIAQKMIEIFCGIELKHIVQIKMTDVNRLVEKFSEMFSEKPKFQHTFKIADKEFGFIPDLENISFGEYIDLDTNFGDVQNLHRAMAVMYRPITRKIKDKYEIEEYNGTSTWADVMKYAPLNVALGAVVFFYHLRNELLVATLNYLEKKVEEMTSTNTQKKHNLENSGDGIIQYTQLLKAIQQDLTMLPEWDYLSASPTSRLKNKKTKLKQEDLNGK